MRRIWAALLMAAGIAMAVFSTALMNDFIRLARPVILMGSRFQPNGTVFESAIAMAVIMLIFIAGLIFIAVGGINIIRPFHKHGGG